MATGGAVTLNIAAVPSADAFVVPVDGCATSVAKLQKDAECTRTEAYLFILDARRRQLQPPRAAGALGTSLELRTLLRWPEVRVSATERNVASVTCEVESSVQGANVSWMQPQTDTGVPWRFTPIGKTNVLDILDMNLQRARYWGDWDAARRAPTTDWHLYDLEDQIAQWGSSTLPKKPVSFDANPDLPQFISASLEMVQRYDEWLASAGAQWAYAHAVTMQNQRMQENRQALENQPQASVNVAEMLAPQNAADLEFERFVKKRQLGISLYADLTDKEIEQAEHDEAERLAQVRKSDAAYYQSALRGSVLLATLSRRFPAEVKRERQALMRMRKMSSVDLAEAVYKRILSKIKKPEAIRRMIEDDVQNVVTTQVPNCQHYKRVRDFLRNTSADLAAVLDTESAARLAVIMANPRGRSESDKAARQNWLQCKHCKRSVICPHQIEQRLLELDHAQPREIEKFAEFYRSPVTFIETRTSVFCRVCSGQLAISPKEPDMVENDPEAVEIRKTIRQEALKLFKFLEFHTHDGRESGVRASNFSQYMVGEATSPAVRMFSQRRGKLRIDASEVVFRDILAILSMSAVALKLIKDSLSQASSQDTLVRIRWRKKLADNFRDAQSAIIAFLGTYSSLFERIPSITNEEVLMRFREFYKDVVERSMGFTFVDPIPVFMEFAIPNNPVYRSALRAMTVDGTLPTSAKKTFQSVMGFPNTLAVPPSPLYAKVFRSKMVEKAMAVINRETSKNDTAKSETSANSKNETSAKGMTLEEAMIICTHDELLKSEEGQRRYMAPQLRKLDKNKYSHIETNAWFTTERVTFSSIPKQIVSIVDVRDEFGRLHVWKAAPNAMPTCTICKRTREECLAMDAVAVELAVIRRDRAISLIHYYTVRCPAGGLHEMNNKVCTKCSFPEGMQPPASTELLSAVHTEYVDKWMTGFEAMMYKENRVIKAAEKPDLDKCTEVPTIVEIDETLFNRVVKSADINPWLIRAIGRMRGRTVVEVETGAKLEEPTLASYAQARSFAATMANVLGVDIPRFSLSMGSYAEPINWVLKALAAKCEESPAAAKAAFDQAITPQLMTCLPAKVAKEAEEEEDEEAPDIDAADKTTKDESSDDDNDNVPEGMEQEPEFGE